jgi:hypothetical protein
MMIKEIGLYSKREGISFEEFKDHFEERYVDIFSAVSPGLAQYCRNYVIPGRGVQLSHLGEGPPPLAFDVITESWYEDEDALLRAKASRQESSNARKLAAEEPLFLDPYKQQAFAVVEHFTPAVALNETQLPPNNSALKIICLMKRNPSLTLNEFIAYYENSHAPLSVRNLPMLSGYSRSYMGVHGSAGTGLDADVMTAIWFHSQADRDLHAATMSRPEVGAIFVKDEEKLFDRVRIQVFEVEEHFTYVPVPKIAEKS